MTDTSMDTAAVQAEKGPSTPAPERAAMKRSRPEDSPPPDFSAPTGTGAGDSPSESKDFPSTPPEGVHPVMWDMLRTIRRDVAKLDDITTRVTAIEDQVDNDGTEISMLKHTVQHLVASNKTLSGRLQRAEIVLSRQEQELSDLRCRSMRDYIIIKTSGDKYREFRGENTDDTVRKFLSEELRIPNSQGIQINSSHRMGHASASYNRMLIARLPRRHDIIKSSTTSRPYMAPLTLLPSRYPRKSTNVASLRGQIQAC